MTVLTEAPFQYDTLPAAVRAMYDQTMAAVAAENPMPTGHEIYARPPRPHGFTSPEQQVPYHPRLQDATPARHRAVQSSQPGRVGRHAATGRASYLAPRQGTYDNAFTAAHAAPMDTRPARPRHAAVETYPPYQQHRRPHDKPRPERYSVLADLLGADTAEILPARGERRFVEFLGAVGTAAVKPSANIAFSDTEPFSSTPPAPEVTVTAGPQPEAQLQLKKPGRVWRALGRLTCLTLTTATALTVLTTHAAH